ncbi:hypothetical protein [Georgenia faecalis]|uniref:Uncharacterized protein n=1 Tax=Georgenia faecalis TaxID=2483799 RepID=A0ABV9D6B6_9MICO|nr:hypothetical protein [Georgenia faecalis]
MDEILEWDGGTRVLTFADRECALRALRVLRDERLPALPAEERWRPEILLEAGEARVARARELLAERGLPVVELAAAHVA